MIHALAIILTFQLAGEAASRALNLPLPGPVLGMLLLFAALVVSNRLKALVRPVAEGILAHLSLLFVPAGVGVVGHLDRLGADGVGLAAALIGSTVAAIAVGALSFVAVARLMGQKDA